MSSRTSVTRFMAAVLVSESLLHTAIPKPHGRSWERREVSNPMRQLPSSVMQMADRALGRATPSPSVAAALAALPPLTIVNRNTHEALTTRLYASDGGIDAEAVRALSRLLSDTRDAKQPKIATIDRRLLQLLYRTAYHFDVDRVELTSGYRMPSRRREGLHGLGRAIDFSLPEVKSALLASYLRGLPRVGVGIYSHRRTGYVHLDVRDRSYHWLDASPPGRTWRGMPLLDRSIAQRDAGYTAMDDWPEAIARP